VTADGGSFQSGRLKVRGLVVQPDDGKDKLPLTGLPDEMPLTVADKVAESKVTIFPPFVYRPSKVEPLNVIRLPDPEGVMPLKPRARLTIPLPACETWTSL
jgi:hypothetical protein